MKKLIILFLAFFSLVTYGGDFTVVINGCFPGAEGRNVRLMKYGDQITYRLVEIDNTIIDGEGNFKFEFNIYEPIYVAYRIDYARVGHYVEPGYTYNIDFVPVDFDTLDDRRNPYLNPWNFRFELYGENFKPDHLNQRILKFDNICDEFLLEHFSAIFPTRLNEHLRKLKSYTDSLFEKDINDNLFFKDYYNYRYAKLYRTANLKRTPVLIEENILGKPVKYNNPQYMDFFNRIFDKYLITESRQISIYDLKTAVNRHNSYYALMDTLGKDTILRNELLRELVLLKGLKNMYHNPEFRKNNVNSILKHVKNYSKFPQHKEIAGNIIFGNTHLRQGSLAPHFSLKNENDDIITLEDFKGKFVLINFFTTWCLTCLAEFSVINDLFEEHGNRMEFISISTDRNSQDFRNFVAENNYPWHFCHFGYDFGFIDTYEVHRFPLFILIDPEGYIIENPAPFPSRGLNRNIARALYNWNLKER